MKYGEVLFKLINGEYYMVCPGKEKFRTYITPCDIGEISGLKIDNEDLLIKAYSTLDGKNDQRFLFEMGVEDSGGYLDVEAIDCRKTSIKWLWMNNELEAMGIEPEDNIKFYLEFHQ